MKVEIVPCLADNYAYILVDESQPQAIIVDPSEPRPILEAITRLGVEPVAILCTHHHADHIGGLPDLLNRFPKIRVLGHPQDRSRIMGLSEGVAHQELVQIGDMSINALYTPGHTLTAITWLVDGCAFTGDTLFVAGCGKVLEGTPEQLYASLNEVIGSLQGDTRIYCGHEYTSKNLKFALRVEPDNKAASIKLQDVLMLRFADTPTVPTTLSDERRYNVFLRCGERAVLETAKREGCKGLDPVSVFTWLRIRKDHFRPSEVGRGRS
ncbi:MAG: hydroxyacylglutathione hydrolase [Deltaproteobacteria bacterium]|nr:hydroxyacylglutathione hydrolase [Deltaproteobacteria bacterium]